MNLPASNYQHGCLTSATATSQTTTSRIAVVWAESVDLPVKDRSTDMKITNRYLAGASPFVLIPQGDELPG